LKQNTGKEVHPEMLTLARETRGLSQSGLARAVEISQGNISRYESGMLKVSDDHLRKIAEALDYPETFFFRQEKRYSFGSSCTYHRKRQSLPATEQKTLLAKLNVLRMRIGWLLEGVDIESENKFQHFPLDEYRGDVELIAQLVRNSWKIPPGPINDLAQVVESAGGIVVRYPFGTRKLDAISQWTVGVPPIFLINEDAPGDRIRFTLAHEIGHVVMHDASTENMEAEADRFAAEFLMPAREIATDLSSVTLSGLAQLKPYWKVSIAALIRRAYDLEKISHRQYRTLFEQLSRLGYRLSEPISIPIEPARVFHQLISVHLNELEYSEEDLTSHIEISRADFETDYWRKPGRSNFQSLQGGLHEREAL
jgi:Zn-dependent peptidase ImmA (M78 family)/transcriptional regulator with XRE-family HTH domain